MAKIALISDTHWGIKNDSPVVYDTLNRFLTTVFFPYIQEHNITKIIHLGDLVDRRKYITGIALNRVRNDFIQPILDRNLECHILVGNHDSVFKNQLEPNYVAEILKDRHDKLYYYDSPEYLKIDDLTILMLPWICKDNHSQCIQMIKEAKARVIFGHLELAGFSMYRGYSAKEGMNPGLFDDYHMVLSGHYHTRSTQKNIHYLGTPVDYTWADYNDPKGFHVLDTETLQLTFIKSPIELHKKITYNDEIDEEKILDECRGKIVRVSILHEINYQKFDLFTSRLSEVASSYTVDDLTVSKEYQVSEEELKVSDTLSIFKSYLNNSKLDSLVEDIYSQALGVK